MIPGDAATLTYTVTVDGVLTAATVSVTVIAPDGASTTPSVANPSTGVYTATVAVTQPGTWSYLWTATGAATDAESGTFLVDPAFLTASITSLVTLEEFTARLGLTPSEDQVRRIVSLLDRASNRVRSYGRSSWTRLTAPGIARDIALDLAERSWNNPRGLTSQSTGSVSESYGGGTDGLLASEIADLRRARGSQVGSIGLKAELGTHVLTRHRGYQWEDLPC